jgi:fumarate reductase subunit D
MRAGTKSIRINIYRGELLWLAALVHRISGLALAIFLPIHFVVLGLALESEQALDGFLRWTDRPAVKLMEAVLVFLVAVHLFGGVRLLVIENLPWFNGQKPLAVLAVCAAVILALAFLLRTL